MGQHHALGPPFRAGGEQDHRRIVRLRPARPLEAPRPRRVHQRAQLVEDRDAGPHVLQIEDAPPLPERGDDIVELGLLDEAPRGDDRRHLGGVAGGAQVADAGGEIEQSRHAAEGGQRQKRRGHALHVGQKHAHRLARGGVARQLAPEQDGAEQQALDGERIALRVLDRDALGPEPGARIEKGGEQGAPRRRDVEIGGCHRASGLLAAFPDAKARRAARRREGVVLRRRGASAMIRMN